MSRATPRVDVLSVPTLSDDRIVRVVTGLRPFRHGSVRIERQKIHGKTLIHNYGHGGAGITLSWGSSLEAADLAADIAPTDVAVIGAGAIGLSTAAVLLERGYRVHIFARDFPPRTTSDLAGAEWSPEAVAHGQTSEEWDRYLRILRRSWQRFQRLEGAEWGVFRRAAYAAEGVELGLEHLPTDLAPPPKLLEIVPIEGHQGPGRLYQTFLIEPPIYMTRLLESVVGNGGMINVRDFSTVDQILDLPEDVIFNCSGLGAGVLFDDDKMQPVRGHLVHFAPEPIAHLFNYDGGYIFPRSDVTVVGTSFEWEFEGNEPDPDIAVRVVARARKFLGQTGGSV